MNYYCIELSAIEFRDTEAALRSLERAEARGEVIETRDLLALSALPGLARLYMLLRLAELED